MWLPESSGSVKLFLDNCPFLVDFQLSKKFYERVKEMAVPKKKSSRSRRDMRRYSAAYKMDPVTETTCAFTHAPVRTHTVSIKAIKEGLYEPRAKKAKTTSVQA